MRTSLNWSNPQSGLKSKSKDHPGQNLVSLLMAPITSATEDTHVHVHCGENICESTFICCWMGISIFLILHQSELKADNK